MPHDHETIVIDSDKHFVIDPVTRTITTESPKLKLMQYDHKSERYTFEIPKTIEGHDMTLCNKIRIHYLNTGSSDRHADIHEVENIQVSKDDPEKLIFSWLIERTATQFAGTLSFAVRFYCILDDSTIDYSWGTDIFNSITVSNGMENTEQIVEDYSDLIASIQKEIEDLKLNGTGGVSDYIDLTNKPSLNGVEISGDKTSEDYKIKAFVNITGNIISGYSSDKTFDEIKTLVDSGCEVIATFTGGGNMSLKTKSSTFFIFQGLNTGTLSKNQVIIKKDGEVNYSVTANVATDLSLGLIKANTATEEDTLPVNIDPNGFLKVAGKAINEITSYSNDSNRYPLKTVVSFMDDDCRAEVFSKLYPAIKDEDGSLKVPYMLSVPTGCIGEQKYLTSDQLKTLLDAGFTASCHTVNETSMADHTANELDEMLTEWLDSSKQLGLSNVLSYAYCNGIYTDENIPMVKKHFRMGFTVDNGINQMPYESYYMKRVGLFANNASVVDIILRDDNYLNANGTLVGDTGAYTGKRVACDYVDVVPGEEYILTCSAVYGGACYAFYDSSRLVMNDYKICSEDTPTGTLLHEVKVKVPEGAAYMLASYNLEAFPDYTLSVSKLPDKSTLSTAKKYVDQVASDGGWLIFMTHSWYKYFDTEDLLELIDYIKEKNIPIKDVNNVIRTSGNVIETGIFKKPTLYAVDPYFVVSAEGRVYTNALEQPETPSNYENVKLTLNSGRVINDCTSVSTGDQAYVVSDYVDVTGCDAIIVTGWAYNHETDTDKGYGGYQVYTIKDKNYNVLSQHTAAKSYEDGGDTLDHVRIELPENAAMVQVAGNIYNTRPALTKVLATS